MPEVTGLCTVTDSNGPCDKPAKYDTPQRCCGMHRNRWLTNGQWDRKHAPGGAGRWADHIHRSLLVCTIDDCPASVESRDLCSTHYQKWRHHGDPLADLRWSPPMECADCGDTYRRYLHGAASPNPELCKACRTRKRRRQWDRATYWADPDAGRARGRRRAQMKRDQILQQLWERDGTTLCYLCILTGSAVPAEGTEVEHKTPRSRGGSDDLDNLAAACKECNRGPGGKWEQTVAEYLTTLDTARERKA